MEKGELTMDWILNFPLVYGFGVIGLLIYLFSWFFLWSSNFENFGRNAFAVFISWISNMLLTVQIIVWIVMLVKHVWSM